MDRPYEPMSSVTFRRLKEIVKGEKIGTSVKTTTDSRKVPFTTSYELHKETEEKKVIDEINRLNLTSDYGV